MEARSIGKSAGEAADRLQPHGWRMSSVLGRVVSLWRYPVKSMRGETLPAAAVEPRGLAGDRLFALRDGNGKFGSGKTTRRFRRIDGLFGFQASLDGEIPVVRFPDGRVLRGDARVIDAALTEALGVAVTLAREDRISHFDNGPLHIVTSASLGWLKGHLPQSAIDARRFRPNVVVEVAGAGLVEQTWLDRVLTIGDEISVKVTVPTERCVMITNPQYELGSDVSIMRTLAQTNDERFGVYADVIASGTIRCGDIVALADANGGMTGLPMPLSQDL